MKIEKNETNNAVVTRLKNVRKHPNADRLQLATVLGDTVIVGLDAREDDLVIYFDSNLALGNTYCRCNNLFSNSELNEDKTKKGYFGKNGRVRTQKLRGENSYGYVAPLESLNMALTDKKDYAQLKEGTEFQKINGIVICEKYVPTHVARKEFNKEKNNKPRKKILTNAFPEHWDTKQFKRFVDTVPVGRIIYLEEKCHGTSNRTVYAPCYRNLTLVDKVLKFFKHPIAELEFLHMNGTRRVCLTKRTTPANSFYKGDMREIAFNKVKNQLHKNEQIYCEIYGFDTNGSAIQKGFPYGCQQGEHKVMLYRVTFNNEDGKVFDMSREYVYRRAEELGLEKPYLFEKYYYTGDKEELIRKVESYTDGRSMIDTGTLREGVVVWFEDESGHWTCLKNKSFDFLNFESKQKDDENFIDIEDEN